MKTYIYYIYKLWKAAKKPFYGGDSCRFGAKCYILRMKICAL